MTNIPYTTAYLNGTAFNCPHCRAYAKQNWFTAHYVFPEGGWNEIQGLKVSFCSHCNQHAIWRYGEMLYPETLGVESPTQDLPPEVKQDYEEAARVLQKSPRSAAALLRLALQKLCVALGGKEKNINADIKKFVKMGLPVKIQQSLDIVRVVGNNAVHPGELDIKDDQQTASMLFQMINLITEKMITEPKVIDTMYAKLPEKTKNEIEQRDNQKKE